MSQLNDVQMTLFNNWWNTIMDEIDTKGMATDSQIMQQIASKNQEMKKLMWTMDSDKDFKLNQEEGVKFFKELAFIAGVAGESNDRALNKVVAIKIYC